MSKVTATGEPSSQNHIAETPAAIRQRYEDTSKLIFQEMKEKPDGVPSFLSYGPSRRCYPHSSYGNPAVIVRKFSSGQAKRDEKSIQSEVCALL